MYTCIVNGITVSRSQTAPTIKQLRLGKWLKDVYVNKDYNTITELQSGPHVSIGKTSVLYTYTNTPHPDALVRLREYLKERVGVILDEHIASIENGYSQGEIKTWDKQEAEAIAYSNDTLSETPMIDKMVSENETKGEIVANILIKANMFAEISGGFLKRRRELFAMIKVANMNTLRKIESDELNVGWIL